MDFPGLKQTLLFGSALQPHEGPCSISYSPLSLHLHLASLNWFSPQRTHSSPSHFINTFSSSHNFCIFSFDPNFFSSEPLLRILDRAVHTQALSLPSHLLPNLLWSDSCPSPFHLNNFCQGRSCPSDCQSEWMYLYPSFRVLSPTFGIDCLLHLTTVVLLRYMIENLEIDTFKKSKNNYQ